MCAPWLLVGVCQRELSEFIGRLDSKTGDIPKTVKRVLTMFDSNADQSIGVDEFAEMNLKYPHLLWPAFRLQYRVQEMTIGLNQWKGAMRRMKQKKDEEEGRTAVRSGCFGCFGLKPAPQPGTRNPSRSQSTIGSGSSTPSAGRVGEARKLNPDRIKRRQSAAASKKLSVMKGRSRLNSHSIHSSNERSLTSHTSHTQHAYSDPTGPRRTTTSMSTTSGNKSLRRTVTHTHTHAVTRGHSSVESEVPVLGRAWASQSIAEERDERSHAGHASTSPPQESINEADMDKAAQSEDDGASEAEPVRIIPRKRNNTSLGHKSSSVHPLPPGAVEGRSRKASSVRRHTSSSVSSPPKTSPVNSAGRLSKFASPSHNGTPLSPGKAHLTRG